HIQCFHQGRGRTNNLVESVILVQASTKNLTFFKYSHEPPLLSLPTSEAGYSLKGEPPSRGVTARYGARYANTEGAPGSKQRRRAGSGQHLRSCLQTMHRFGIDFLVHGCQHGSPEAWPAVLSASNQRAANAQSRSNNLPVDVSVRQSR